MKKSLQSYIKIALIAVLAVMISVMTMACGKTGGTSETSHSEGSASASASTSERDTARESDEDGNSESETPVAKVKITFVCEGATLKEIEVDKGEVPVYDGETPVKASTADKVFTFKGWNPALTEATADAVYVAEFDETVRKYFVKIGDGEATEVEYGSHLEKPDDPTKETTESADYEFIGWFNGEEQWDFETDVVEGDVTLEARFNEIKRKYNVTVDGVTKEYDFGAKLERPEAKKGCLVIAKDADGNEWKFETDVVKGEVTLTTENRLIMANGSDLYAYKEWASEDAGAIAELNGMEKESVHLSPVNFENNGIRVAAAANAVVTVVFPKINYNAYGKTEFKFICNWGTRLIHIGDTVEDGDANKLGSYKGNAGGDWNEYYVITIEGTSVRMFDKTGAEVSTWINGALAAVEIPEEVASGEEPLKLTLSGGGQNLEFSDIFCHIAKNDDMVTVHEWTEDEVENAECRYTNLTYARVAGNSKATSNWSLDWQGRLVARGAGYAGVKIPLINFNEYSSVSFYVYCNWGTRDMKTGDNGGWLDQYAVGTVGNTGDAYGQYGIITVKDGKMYFRLNTDEAETEVRTLTDGILNGTENIILSFRDGGGNNIVISDFLCSAEDYIKALN